MFVVFLFSLVLLGPSSLFRCSPNKNFQNWMSLYDTLIHFTDVCVPKTIGQRKPHQFYCLSVSREEKQKKKARCVGFVRHFTH